jgi:aryl-alcohol dehydrogenase-like predicted oxidoreductase
MTLAQLALAWVVAQPGVTAAIAGSRWATSAAAAAKLVLGMRTA